MSREETTSTDHEKRRKELERRFNQLPPDKVRKQLAILPYYNALENEITQSKRGIFVTHYFLTKWAPELGQPASNIVLALQKLSDKHSGVTIASLDKIATLAGIGLSTLKRWLSTSEREQDRRSPKQRKQWELLHEYWIKEIRARYRQYEGSGGQSQTRRTTSAIRVSIDDPVHPDDFTRLHVLAAERIANEEYEEHKRRNRGEGTDNDGSSYKSHSETHKRPKEIIREDGPPGFVENSPYESQNETHTTSPERDGLSLSDRINVTNVSKKSFKGTLRADPRVQALTTDQKVSREALAAEISENLKRMAGDRSVEQHKSAGFHKRVAFLMPKNLVYEALSATRDAIEEQHAGRKSIGQVSAYFAGIVRQIAAKNDIDLGIQWKGRQPVQSR